MAIRDARRLDPPPSLDVEGFMLARHVTAVEDLYDEKAVKRVYYREVEALVKEVTGASRVVAFDHNVRNTATSERGEKGAPGPVRYAHNDYTERSGLSGGCSGAREHRGPDAGVLRRGLTSPSQASAAPDSCALVYAAATAITPRACRRPSCGWPGPGHAGCSLLPHRARQPARST